MSAAVTKLLTNTPQDFPTPGSVETQAWPVDDGWSAAGIDADDAWPANTIGIDETWAAESAGAYKVSPFLNWYDVGSCFFSDSLQIESKSAFIISCLGVLIYAAGFQALCRWAKTCDRVMAGAQDVKPSDRFNVWADLGRAGIYTLRALYLLPMMMLVIYFNAWYMLCTLLGTFLGFFFFRGGPDMDAMNKREQFHEFKSLP